MKIVKNPNKNIFDEVSKAVHDNGGYCPCKIEHVDDTLCPCKEFILSNNVGECHCGRYIKEEV